MKSLKNLTIVFLVLLLIGSCGKVKSAGSHAEIIPAPMSGYTCFVIKSDEGNAVGGSCLKE